VIGGGSQIEEEQRESGDKDGAASEENKRGARMRESRGERQMELSQGLVRNFKKLQGPFCKV
jgi:hypothetical protein